MKLNKIIYTLFLGLAVLLASCEVDEKKPAPYDVGLDNVPAGAYLKTVSSSTEINLFDIPNNTFEVTLEHNDNADGTLLQDVSVFLSFDDNSIVDDNDISVAESLYTTIPASAFSSGNKPTVTYTDATPDALAFLGLTEGDLNGTDVLQYRFQVNLTDGSSFTNTNTNPNIISEQAFASPFLYNASVVCPVDPTTFIGSYEVTIVSPGVFGAGTYGADGVIVDLVENGSSRTFTADYFNDSRFNREFTLELTCGQVIIPRIDMAVGCAGNSVNLVTGPPEGENGVFDPLDDSTFTVNITDNVDSDCGGTPVQASYIFTKI